MFLELNSPVLFYFSFTSFNVDCYQFCFLFCCGFWVLIFLVFFFFEGVSVGLSFPKLTKILLPRPLASQLLKLKV